MHKESTGQLPSGSSPRVVVWHTSDVEDASAADRFAGIPRVVIGRARVLGRNSISSGVDKMEKVTCRALVFKRHGTPTGEGYRLRKRE